MDDVVVVDLGQGLEIVESCGADHRQGLFRGWGPPHFWGVRPPDMRYGDAIISHRLSPLHTLASTLAGPRQANLATCSVKIFLTSSHRTSMFYTKPRVRFGRIAT